MSDKSRRKILKSIAAGSGAVIAGKSLPENWTKPVVDSVLLPVHAQTSVESFTYSATINNDIPQITSRPNETPDQTFDFNATDVTPVGGGTVDVTALGDLDDGTNGRWEIAVEGNSIGFIDPTGAGPECGSTPVQEVFNVSQAILEAAAADGTITVTATNGGLIQSFCTTQYVNVTLEFPATGTPPTP